MSTNIPKSNKMPKIIAICGAKRSGKDILAEHLVSKYNYERVAFADPLKVVVKGLFNFDDDQVGIGKDMGTGKKDIVDEKWGITPRVALQFFGTEIMQEKIQELLPNIKKNFFANTLKNYINDRITENEEPKFVISDLRFIHEFEMLYTISKIQKKDIVIIRVIRPYSSNSRADTEDTENTHVSELEYMTIPYDIILINNGSIDNYIEKFDKIISI
jgi:dephospho-CoA kinase